jgi:hypothetical protein
MPSLREETSGAKEGSSLLASVDRALLNNHEPLKGIGLAVLAATTTSVGPLLLRYARMEMDSNWAVVALKYFAVGCISLLFAQFSSGWRAVSDLLKGPSLSSVLLAGGLLMSANLAWTFSLLMTTVGHATSAPHHN